MANVKYDYGDELGTLTQYNFRFLEQLWKDGSELRKELFNYTDEDRLRQWLKTKHNIMVADDVRIVILDLENARIKKFVENPQNEKFYALVLPPRPQGYPGNKQYRNMQAWNTAHYHAINDSYGM